MVSVVVVVSVLWGEEVVTSQAGIKASLAVPLLVWPVPLLAPAEAVELSSVRWEADSVVRANLAVVVVLLVVVLPLLPVVPFLPGVGSRDALRALPPVVPDDADRTFCALGGASLDRMGRSRTHT